MNLRVVDQDLINAVLDQGIKLSSNFDDILYDDEIDIVVELIGGIEPAQLYYEGPWSRGSMLQPIRI